MANDKPNSEQDERDYERLKAAEAVAQSYQEQIASEPKDSNLKLAGTEIDNLTWAVLYLRDAYDGAKGVADGALKTFARPSAAPTTGETPDTDSLVRLINAVRSGGDETGVANAVNDLAAHARRKERDADHFYQLSGRYLEEKNQALLDAANAKDAAGTPSAAAPTTPTAEMCDAVRGVLQILRGKGGATFSEVYEHCRNRGDDVRKWPQWARDSEGYVNEMAAACLIYELMRAADDSGQPVTVGQTPLKDIDLMRLYDASFNHVFPGPSRERDVPVLQIMALREFAERLLKTVGQPVVAAQMPAEPTREMLDAWSDVMRGVARHRPSTIWPGLHYSDSESLMVDAYRAMLKAVPQAPCTPRQSTPGPSNRIAPTAENDAAGPAKTDSGVQPAATAPSAIAPRIVRDISVEELAKMDLRPGPIQVVYPLDEEWNAAIEAAAKVAMDMPLQHSEERHSYRWTDTAKAMALDIQSAIKRLHRSVAAGTGSAPAGGKS